jgi:hypothetical protein
MLDSWSFGAAGEVAMELLRCCECGRGQVAGEDSAARGRFPEHEDMRLSSLLHPAAFDA